MVSEISACDLASPGSSLGLGLGRWIEGYLEKGVQVPMGQGRSTKILSMIKWIRNSRLSIQNSLSWGKGQRLRAERAPGPRIFPRIFRCPGGPGLWFRVQGSGIQVSGSGFRVQGFGCRVPGVRFRVQGSCLRASDSELRVWGFGFGVCGLGFIVWGLGFRV